MIISHQHKFIFLRTRKTAGTSMQLALESICSKDDIFSTEVILSGIEKKRITRPIFRTHYPACKVKALIPKEWDTYFKFCFERNPWDKVVSMYHHRKSVNKEKEADVTPFTEWCTRAYLDEENEIKTMRRRFPLDSDKYLIDGKYALDYIGYYETLHKDFDNLCTTLGLTNVPSLTNRLGAYRKDYRHIHYRNYFNTTTREQVAERFVKEIEMFDYSF